MKSYLLSPIILGVESANMTFYIYSTIFFKLKCRYSPNVLWDFAGIHQKFVYYLFS